MSNRQATNYALLTEAELAHRISARDEAAVNFLMTRSNRRLFRIAWSILRNREDAEDALQTAYMRAFSSIGTFQGRSSLETWFIRIVINEGLMRRRSARRVREHLPQDPAAAAEQYADRLMGGSASLARPDTAMTRRQTLASIEAAMAILPVSFRMVFVLREIEDMSIAEVAAALDLPAATVKTRHSRAKEKLRRLLRSGFHDLLPEALPFAGADCAGLTARVVSCYCRRLGIPPVQAVSPSAARDRSDRADPAPVFQ